MILEQMAEALRSHVLFTLLLMIMLHIIADYLMQTDFIKRFKQKKVWEELFKDIGLDENNKYKYDYIVVLLVHAFSWSFITFLPIILISNVTMFIIATIVNTIIHAIIDDLKANKYKINLLVDQGLHLLQIIITILVVNLLN